MKRCSQNGITR